MTRDDSRPVATTPTPGDTSWQSPELSSLSYVRLSQPLDVIGAHVATVDSANSAALVGLLHPDEIALSAQMPEARRASFAAGRVALRAAVARTNRMVASSPLLRTNRGAPSLPVGIVGSLSHKRSVAVAVAAPHLAQGGQIATVGIDIEERVRTGHVRRDISKRILVDEEFALLPSDTHDREDAILLLFALKEAIYKAIDPYVQRHVHFKEVAVASNEVLSGDRGAVEVRLLLPEFAGGGPAVRASWWREELHVVAIASTSRAP